MTDKNNSIHDFDFKLICEYFSSIERQGPGSPEVTIKALSFIDNLTSEAKIADIGCGTGGQTIVLAKNTTGQISAFDLSPEFIERLNSNCQKENLQNRVKGIVRSMENLPFENEELDLIWSEGAIYNIGYERGLKEWHKLLKKDAFIAISEASWFTDERPDEIQKFWDDAYPEIDTIPNKIKQMQAAGYIPIASFVLPEYCWIDNFFVPQISAQEIFLQKYAGNKTAEEFVENEKHGAELYNKYKKYYGYVFYIGQKI